MVLTRFPFLTWTVMVGVAGFGWWLVSVILRTPLWPVEVGFSVFAGIVAARSLLHMIQRIRRGAFGVDLLAVAAIASTVAVGEAVAALLVVLMLTGGEALEAAAELHARRPLDALLRKRSISLPS